VKKINLTKDKIKEVEIWKLNVGCRHKRGGGEI
jgi:hypothetical protein